MQNPLFGTEEHDYKRLRKDKSLLIWISLYFLGSSLVQIEGSVWTQTKNNRMNPLSKNESLSRVTPDV